MEEGGIHAAEVHSPNNDRLFKYPPQLPNTLRPRISVDPGESVPLFRVPFTARKCHYLEGTQARITVRVFAGDRLAWKEELPVAEMLSPERLRYYLRYHSDRT
jgi:hypothetical protein